MQLLRCPLSLHVRSCEQVPSLTVQMARAGKPGGRTAMWVRDHLDGLWCDEDFADWYLATAAWTSRRPASHRLCPVVPARSTGPAGGLVAAPWRSRLRSRDGEQSGEREDQRAVDQRDRRVGGRERNGGCDCPADAERPPLIGRAGRPGRSGGVLATWTGREASGSRAHRSASAADQETMDEFRASPVPSKRHAVAGVPGGGEETQGCAGTNNPMTLLTCGDRQSGRSV